MSSLDSMPAGMKRLKRLAVKFKHQHLLNEGRDEENEDEGRKRMLLFLACKQEITDDWMIGVALGSRMSR